MVTFTFIASKFTLKRSEWRCRLCNERQDCQHLNRYKAKWTRHCVSLAHFKYNPEIEWL